MSRSPLVIAGLLVGLLGSMPGASATGILLNASSAAGGAGAHGTYNDGTPGCNYTCGLEQIISDPQQQIVVSPNLLTDPAGTSTFGSITTTAFSRAALTAPVVTTSTSLAAASMAQASLHVSHSDNGTCGNACQPPDVRYGAGSGQAIIYDTLTFQNPGGAPTSVGVHGVLHGTAFNGGPNGSGFVEHFFDLNGSGSSPRASFGISQGFGENAPTINADGLGWSSIQFSPTNDPLNLEFTGWFPITGTEYVADLVYYLSAQCSAGFTCDYGNTAYLNFILPEGVTFTSESGVFLTAPIPEPASLGLLTAGLAGLGAARRRWRNRMH